MKPRAQNRRPYIRSLQMVWKLRAEETTSTYLVTVAFTLVDQGVVELDEDLLDVEADQGVVPVGHGDLAGQPKQALRGKENSHY